MDLIQILAELREEANRLHQAIDAVERLVRDGGKRRGRPPKALSDLAKKMKPLPNVAAAVALARSE